MQGGERGRAKVIRGETESAAGKRGGGRESASDNEVGLRVKTMTQESLKGDMKPLPRPRDENVADNANNRVAAAPVMPTGEEPEEVDVAQFYLQTDALDPCASPKAEAAALVDQLDSASWTVACAALVSTRRLAAHHPQELTLVLEAVLPRLRNHINSLRSSLCKTALMCAADVFTTYRDDMLEHLCEGSPSLLGSLLCKAALEKRFVMDEAKRTLGAMVNCITSDALLNMLLLHVSEANPKVRAVVAKFVADTVDKALKEREPGVRCCVDVACEELLRAAAIFINDRQPGARECARKLITQLREMYIENESPIEWTPFVEKILGKPVAAKLCKI